MSAKTSNPPRILLGPQEISGFYGNLEGGFSQIGVPARLVTTHPHPFGYTQLQRNPFFARCASWAVLKHRTSHRFVKPIWAALYVAASILLTFWAVFRFDVFIFAWGTSFLPLNLDIPFLRLFGKKVFVILGHGSEARPPYMSTPPYDGYPATDGELKRLRAQVNAVAASVRRNERFASQVIGMQMTAQFLKRSFIDFYRLGLPTPLGPGEAIDNEQRNDKVTILHVPSNKAVKGTAHIRAVMNAVTEKFPYVEYRELSDVAHSEILEAMKSADIILDWLWSDIPMAVVGTEAAALSKPTIISSYGWQQWSEWEKLHGSQFMPPIIAATPDTLTSVVEDAVTDRKMSSDIGVKARKFIESTWAPAQIARNYLRVVTGNYPQDWILEPDQIGYLWGAGVSRDNVLKMVDALLKSGCSDPLCWSRGEELYRKILITEPADGEL